jgi:transcription antitermination factor NusA-like protein
MASTIDMQDIRYLNLFSRITRINTRFCFKYNEAIFFCVPKNLLSKAIGERAINIKKINEVLRKRIRIIACPEGIESIKPFIESIVSPVTFKELEVKGNEVILTAGSQSKAALLGRNRRRLLEMQKIIADYFQKEFKII